jgi:hypothetical protein
VPLFMLSRELHGMRSVGTMLPKDQALEEAKRQGVSVKVPEEGISSAALGILVERRKDEAARDMLFARKEGAAASLGMFGAQLAGSFMDPVNAAAGFIPVLGGTRYAAALGKAATTGSRLGVRAGIGAVEGLVGAAAVEGPTLNLRRDLQDDYTLYDSLANIAFGTFASSGLRDGRRSCARPLERSRGCASGGLPALDRALRMESRTDCLRAAGRARHERDLEHGFERGPGPSDELPLSMGIAARRRRAPAPDRRDIGRHARAHERRRDRRNSSRTRRSSAPNPPHPVPMTEAARRRRRRRAQVPRDGPGRSARPPRPRRGPGRRPRKRARDRRGHLRRNPRAGASRPP